MWTFNEYLPPEDNIIDKVLWQISLRLSTQDLEYRISFSKLLLEHCKQDPNYKVAKITIFVVFGCSFNVWWLPDREEENKGLIQLLRRNDVSEEHFDIKFRSFVQSLRNKLLQSSWKNLFFRFVMTPLVAIFDFDHNFAISRKYLYLEISG